MEALREQSGVSDQELADCLSRDDRFAQLFEDLLRKVERDTNRGRPTQEPCVEWRQPRGEVTTPR